MSTKKIHFIAPIPNISNRTRAIKIANVLREQEVNICFWGWVRNSDDLIKENVSLESKSAILNTSYFPRKIQSIFYFIWIFIVFIKLLFIPRNSVIWCLGLETAFPASLASKFKKFHIIFDDADRLILLKKYPKFMVFIIRRLELFVSRNVKTHIVPNLRRYDYRNTNQLELKNTPNIDDFEKALSMKEFDWLTNKLDGRLIVYVNGWLSPNRGINIVNRLNSGFELNNVCWLVAGKNDNKESNALVTNENTIYLGELDNIKALSIYKYVDYVLTYYEPISQINKFAEANKWGDALYFDIPIIYNLEVETAEFIKENNYGVGFYYNDLESLAEYLRVQSSLTKGSRKKYNKGAKENLPSFKHALTNIIRGAYEE